MIISNQRDVHDCLMKSPTYMNETNVKNGTNEKLRVNLE